VWQEDILEGMEGTLGRNTEEGKRGAARHRSVNAKNIPSIFSKYSDDLLAMKKFF